MEYTSQLKQLLLSCRAENIELAIALATSQQIDLEKLIKELGFNVFELYQATDFINLDTIHLHDVSSDDIQLLEQLPHLLRVDIWSPITDAEIEQIKQFCPNCIIQTWYGYQ